MRRAAGLILASLLLAGCVTPGGRLGADARWPSLSDLGSAAKNAARKPGTWAPLAGAALLMIDDQDAELSEWIQRERPLFGSKARNRSDDIEALLAGTYVVTALVAPSDSVSSKLKTLGVGAATIVLEGGVTKGLKGTFKRERPGGENDKSLPSGHAGRASALATMSASNFEAMSMNRGARIAAQTSVHLASAAGAWARVEAGKHHASDVLVGNAVGHFLAAFMEEAFLHSNVHGVAVRFSPVDDGGAVTVSLSLP